MPGKIVAYSTGNHALAMAYTAKLFGIHARVYLPQNVSPIKKRIAKYYGAEVMEVKTRLEAENLSKKDGDNGFYYLHPSDDDQTIAGAGTMCYEALIEMKKRNIKMPEAIFASCGGGGLLAGTYLAKNLLSPSSKLIGAEPEIANDAYKSLQSGEINRFDDSPKIYYWTAWLMQTTKVTCEPSAAISMAAAYNWLKENNAKKTILILISGGNIDPSLYQDLWNQDHLAILPE